MLKAWRDHRAKARVRGRVFECALCLSLLALAGCESVSGLLGGGPEKDTAQAAEKADESGRPVFSIGDRYRFDNPEITWEVTAVHGERVYWRSASGDEQVTSSNPLLPAFAWQSTRRGSGQRIISNRSGDLFPLKVGAKMSFRSTVSTDKPPFGWEFEWSCEVVGKANITVPAGVFDSFRVLCGRQGSRELTFYYVPEIGHYARMEAIGSDGKKTATRNLVAYEHGETSVSSVDTSLASAEIVSPAQKGGGYYQPPPTTAAQAPPVDASVTSRTPNFSAEGSQAVSVSKLPDPALKKKIDIAKLPAFGLEKASPSPESAALSRQGQVEARAASIPAPAAATTSSVPAVSAPAVTTPTIPVAKPALKPLAARPAAEHDVLVHLASYRDLDAARRGWLALRKRYDPLFDGLDPEIQRVELTGKGIYFRLYAVSLPSASVAQEFCRQLKERGGWCSVSRR